MGIGKAGWTPEIVLRSMTRLPIVHGSVPPSDQMNSFHGASPLMSHSESDSVAENPQHVAGTTPRQGQPAGDPGSGGAAGSPNAGAPGGNVPASILDQEITACQNAIDQMMTVFEDLAEIGAITPELENGVESLTQARQRLVEAHAITDLGAVYANLQQAQTAMQAALASGGSSISEAIRMQAGEAEQLLAEALANGQKQEST